MCILYYMIADQCEECEHTVAIPHFPFPNPQSPVPTWQTQKATLSMLARRARVGGSRVRGAQIYCFRCSAEPVENLRPEVPLSGLRKYLCKSRA